MICVFSKIMLYFVSYFFYYSLHAYRLIFDSKYRCLSECKKKKKKNKVFVERRLPESVAKLF